MIIWKLHTIQIILYRYDYLIIHDSDGTSLGPNRMCGNTIPATIESNTNQIFVNFVSDSSDTGKGVHINYSAGKNLKTVIF